MSKKSKREAQRKEWNEQPPTDAELNAAIEHEWLVDMVGEEDAAYFEAAGIDDIGNK